MQPLVPIREEVLHIPSTLASHHLNVTVIVQDKDKTGPASERRAVGKAVMDMANYSDNFISYDMIEKLDDTHLSNPALKAMMLCRAIPHLYLIVYRGYEQCLHVLPWHYGTSL